MSVDSALLFIHNSITMMLFFAGQQETEQWTVLTTTTW